MFELVLIHVRTLPGAHIAMLHVAYVHALHSLVLWFRHISLFQIVVSVSSCITRTTSYFRIHNGVHIHLLNAYAHFFHSTVGIHHCVLHLHAFEVFKALKSLFEFNNVKFFRQESDCNNG